MNLSKTRKKEERKTMGNLEGEHLVTDIWLHKRLTRSVKVKGYCNTICRTQGNKDRKTHAIFVLVQWLQFPPRHALSCWRGFRFRPPAHRATWFMVEPLLTGVIIFFCIYIVMGVTQTSLWHTRSLHIHCCKNDLYALKNIYVSIKQNAKVNSNCNSL